MRLKIERSNKRPEMEAPILDLILVGVLRSGVGSQ